MKRNINRLLGICHYFVVIVMIIGLPPDLKAQGHPVMDATRSPAGLRNGDWLQVNTLMSGYFPTNEQTYLKASNTSAGDSFGFSVAISGDTLVVGARWEDSNATGVNGEQENEETSDSGAAYVFIRSNGVWSQQAYLKASNTGINNNFGSSVAISGDTIVVGAEKEDSDATGVNGAQDNDNASGSGAAYVFTRSDGVWSQQAYLKASNTGNNDRFGDAVAISGDTLVVGARSEDSNATGVNGDGDDNSADSAGAAYVFTRDGTTWSQQAYLKASNSEESDMFGEFVAIDGDTVVIGAVFEDSNATGVDGIQTDNSLQNSGAAYVFNRVGESWSQQAYLKASNTGYSDCFGSVVTISGDTLVVGAFHEESNATGVDGNESDNSASSAGAAYVFTRDGSTWSQQAYLKASNTGRWDNFGWSAALAGDMLVVGANCEESNATGVNGDQLNNSMACAGAAYVFTRTGGVWSQQAYLKATNTDVEDYMGEEVIAISGNTILVGAMGEDSNAIGVNGLQSDNSSSFSGAAYVTELYFYGSFLPLITK
jgi:hypothetical protein